MAQAANVSPVDAITLRRMLDLNDMLAGRGVHMAKDIQAAVEKSPKTAKLLDGNLVMVARCTPHRKRSLALAMSRKPWSPAMIQDTYWVELER